MHIKWDTFPHTICAHTKPKTLYSNIACNGLNGGVDDGEYPRNQQTDAPSKHLYLQCEQTIVKFIFFPSQNYNIYWSEWTFLNDSSAFPYGIQPKRIQFIFQFSWDSTKTKKKTRETNETANLRSTAVIIVVIRSALFNAKKNGIKRF